jgi:hypothetical protein
MKSSQEISCVQMELVSNIFETSLSSSSGFDDAMSDTVTYCVYSTEYSHGCPEGTVGGSGS